MTLRTPLIALMLFASPAAAMAADIVVSAGEHGAYSRVVVPAGAGPVSVTQSENTVGLHFSPREAGFDLSDINERRKARRLARAHAVETPAGAVVRLDLACDCRIEQQKLPDGRLVIDIHDRAPKPARVASAKPAAEAPAKETQSPAQAAPPSVSVEEARARMIELLQQAADDGLVTVRDGASELSKPTPLTPAAASAPAKEPAPAPRPQVACLPDAAFALDGAGLEDNPLSVLSERQSMLAAAPVGAEDDAAAALAQSYLAVGFGEEALATLEEYGAAHSLHAEMARIVADRPLSRGGVFEAAGQCRGAHALWQAAALEGAPAAAAAKRSGEAVTLLPKRLRANLATRIARKMVEAQAFDEARRFHDIAAAAGNAKSADLQYVAARLLEQEGASADAKEMLESVAADNTDASKDALLSLAAHYAETGETPPEGFAEQLGALAKTEQGSPTGGQAALREAMLWAKEGNIEAGVMLLQSAARSDPALKALASARARDLVRPALRGSDEHQMAKGLDAYLQHKDFIEDGAGEESLAADAGEAARRLGVPNVSARLLTQRAASPEAALKRARALLEANDPERALEAASPYADEAAFARLIVDANLALERNYAALAAASALSDETDKPALMASIAWRAGDWASAARAYQKIDPRRLTPEQAQRYALAAYMSGARAIPPAAEAVLRESEHESLPGLAALFERFDSGGVLERGRAAIAGAQNEIDLIEGALSDG